MFDVSLVRKHAGTDTERVFIDSTHGVVERMRYLLPVLQDGDVMTLTIVAGLNGPAQESA